MFIATCSIVVGLHFSLTETINQTLEINQHELQQPIFDDPFLSFLSFLVSDSLRISTCQIVTNFLYCINIPPSFGE